MCFFFQPGESDVSSVSMMKRMINVMSVLVFQHCKYFGIYRWFLYSVCQYILKVEFWVRVLYFVSRETENCQGHRKKKLFWQEVSWDLCGYRVLTFIHPSFFRDVPLWKVNFQAWKLDRLVFYTQQYRMLFVRVHRWSLKPILSL